MMQLESQQYLPAPTHVLECIEKWRDLDLRKKEDSEIDAELSTFLDDLEKYFASTIDKNYFNLWRIRKLNDLIKNISECWEPPSSVCPMGRCNAKGEPVLYTSLKLKTPFEEMQIRQQEHVCLIKYKQIHNLKLFQVVPKDFIAKDLNGERFYSKDEMLSYQILREFIRSEFLKPVGKGTEYLHCISASMCRIWFNDHDSDGWLYPSVPAPEDFNIAVKTKSAHAKLKIEDVRIV